MISHIAGKDFKPDLTMAARRPYPKPMERKVEPGGQGPDGAPSLPTGSPGASARHRGGGSGIRILGYGASA